MKTMTRETGAAHETRALRDLVSIGPAMVRDFELLGVRRVEELVGRDPHDLYDELCRRSGVRQDPCVLDTFTAAVAQANDPNLPPEQCQWWYWSRVRKGENPRPRSSRRTTTRQGRPSRRRAESR